MPSWLASAWPLGLPLARAAPRRCLCGIRRPLFSAVGLRLFAPLLVRLVVVVVVGLPAYAAISMALVRWQLQSLATPKPCWCGVFDALAGWMHRRPVVTLVVFAGMFFNETMPGSIVFYPHHPGREREFWAILAYFAVHVVFAIR